MATNYYARLPYQENYQLLNAYVREVEKEGADRIPFVRAELRAEILTRMEKGSKREEDLHIGKSSGGWVFALHVISEKRLYGLPDWMILLDKPDVIIFEKVDGQLRREISLDDLLKVITERKFEGNDNVNHLFHVVNKSMPAENGLVRKVIDGERCVGHEFAADGRGVSWDLIAGDFM
jgi:hypothetical protein